MPAYFPLSILGEERNDEKGKKNTSKILLFVKLNYLILNQFVLAGGVEREEQQTSNNPTAESYYTANAKNHIQVIANRKIIKQQ